MWMGGLVRVGFSVCAYCPNPPFSLRLSAVILYEQVFGDNFLHTVQARQCIGQACRSALITPLIEKLTLRSKSCSQRRYDVRASLCAFRVINIVLNVQIYMGAVGVECKRMT